MCNSPIYPFIQRFMTEGGTAACVHVCKLLFAAFKLSSKKKEIKTFATWYKTRKISISCKKYSMNEKINDFVEKTVTGLLKLK